MTRVAKREEVYEVYIILSRFSPQHAMYIYVCVFVSPNRKMKIE